MLELRLKRLFRWWRSLSDGHRLLLVAVLSAGGAVAIIILWPYSIAADFAITLLGMYAGFIIVTPWVLYDYKRKRR